MNTEALFLFLILLLGLVLCSFLGGKCNKEPFTGSFNGKFNVQPDSQMNNNTNSSDSSGSSDSNGSSGSSGSSSSSGSSGAGNNNNSNNYDNYNHYSGTSSQLTNGATFYGENGGSVQVNMQSDGSPTLKVTLSKGQQPITFSTSQSNSSNSDTNSSSMMNPLTSIFGNSTSSSTTENYTNFNSSKSESVNLQFYGPNGETALVINYQGQKAIQVNTNKGSYIYTMNNPVSSNQSASNPFNSNYTHYNNTPSTYYGSTGVTGANVNNSNLAYNNSSPMPSSQTQTTTSSSYDYSNSLPPGIPKRMIPPGHEDLYILKSEIVPPVCPACPASAACPRQEPCPPCPACARCPEPAFECKKVPNYNSINNDYLPSPVVNDFSSFGM
jgi:hypothetical protein